MSILVLTRLYNPRDLVCVAVAHTGWLALPCFVGSHDDFILPPQLFSERMKDIILCFRSQGCSVRHSCTGQFIPKGGKSPSGCRSADRTSPGSLPQRRRLTANLPYAKTVFLLDHHARSNVNFSHGMFTGFFSVRISFVCIRSGKSAALQSALCSPED